MEFPAVLGAFLTEVFQRRWSRGTATKHVIILGRTPGGPCNNMLLGRVEGSFKEVLLRRVLRRHLVRVSVRTWGSKGS